MVNVLVIPCYVGDRLDFQDDEYEAYRLLMEIIGNFNKLQDPKFYSFPLGILTKKKFAISWRILAAFTAHLRGALYVPIVEAIKNFSMHMVVSGPATGTL